MALDIPAETTGIGWKNGISKWFWTSQLSPRGLGYIQAEPLLLGFWDYGQRYEWDEDVFLIFHNFQHEKCD